MVDNGGAGGGVVGNDGEEPADRILKESQADKSEITEIKNGLN